MKINKQEFLQSLESLQYGLSKREILQQSSCFCFMKGKIHTFNDEIACRVPSGLDKEFKGAVVADPLLKILRKIDAEEIEIVFTDTEINISNKGEKIGIRLEKEITLPIDLVEKPKSWLDLPEGFSDAVNIVQSCAGLNKEEFTLTCVNIHTNWIEAFDKAQFCRWKLNTNIIKPTIVAQTSIKHISSLGMVGICETPNWIHFRNLNNLVFSCRRYMDDYPDLTKFFEMEGSKITLPKGLGQAADKANIFSSENLENKNIHIELSQNKVKLKGIGISGWYSKAYKLSYSGPDLNFMISPKILSDLVKKHVDCLICDNRLKVETGSYQYVSRLSKPE